MTRKEQKAKRPERWEEVKARYNARELTFQQAADELGISIQWFNTLLRRDEPGRKTFKHEHGKEIGKARKKWTTYLQKHFSDYELCMMLKSRGNCDRCPQVCKGYMGYKGLGAKLVAKALLKDEEKPLEESKDEM